MTDDERVRIEKEGHLKWMNRETDCSDENKPRPPFCQRDGLMVCGATRKFGEYTEQCGRRIRQRCEKRQKGRDRDTKQILTFAYEE